MNANSSTTSHWLHKSTVALTGAGISTSRLDALVLLEDATGKDRAWLLAHQDFNLSAKQLSILESNLKRRLQHEPLAYIRGKSEFYGRDFIVNEHTLEPRPETETMVELALTSIDSSYVILDVGTGSGAIAITMKLELPGATVVATDIDHTCTKTAKVNAGILGADVHFFTGNLLQPIPNSSYQAAPNIAVLANLPYVPDAYKLNQAAMHEPKTAIFGGKDGLDLYRELFTHISNLNPQPTSVFTESLPFQHKSLEGIAKQAGYSLAKTVDFVQLFTA